MYVALSEVIQSVQVELHVGGCLLWGSNAVVAVAFATGMLVAGRNSSTARGQPGRVQLGKLCMSSANESCNHLRGRSCTQR